MSKRKIRNKNIALSKLVWYAYISGKKHNKRLNKKLNAILDYYLYSCILISGEWVGKEEK